MARFIDISKTDNHYFADSNGKTWIPTGCNLCFFRNSENFPDETVMATYKEWLANFAAAGGNFIRIWLGVPFFDVMPEKPGQYDRKNTSHIRFIIETCETLGIKIKFTFEHFRRIMPDITDIESYAGAALFHKPIYGELVRTMSEYFASEECRKIYLDRAKYFAEQGFGDSEAVIAWELWNEINNTAPMDEVAEWSDYMIAELQKIFPNQMILQNIGSFSCPWAYKLYDYLAAVKDNGFLQVHRYLDPGAEIEACSGAMDILCSDAVREMRLNDNLLLPENMPDEIRAIRTGLDQSIDTVICKFRIYTVYCQQSQILLYKRIFRLQQDTAEIITLYSARFHCS